MHGDGGGLAELGNEVNRVCGGGLDQPARRVVAGVLRLLVVVRAGHHAIGGHRDPDGLRGAAICQR